MRTIAAFASALLLVTGCGGGSATVDEGAARRIADFLRRKGFDYEVVNRVVYELLRKER